MPFAAYWKIVWEFFRDQNVFNEDVPFPGHSVSAWISQDSPLSDGDNSALQSYYTMAQRAWEHDYFTSALPWTQRGSEATLPLGTNANIEWVDNDQASIARDPATDPNAPINLGSSAQINTISGGFMEFDLATNLPFQVDNTANLQVDLSTATAASINDFFPVTIEGSNSKVCDNHLIVS